IAAMVTYKTGRPCRFNYTRREEFSISRTRHPMRIRMKIGASKDGKILADQMYVLSNTGAYGSHALTVASNAASKVLPLYPTENVKFDTDVVYTNLPVGGAYRGYGATQGHYAQECAIDELAEKLGIDPLEFRIKNHIRKGGTSPIFKAIGEGKEGTEMYINSCGLPKCISLGAKEIKWKKMRKLKDKGRFRRGVGVAILMQGSSIPYVDMAAAFMKMNEDGSFNLQMGATDLGTGSDTVLSQIAAEVLDVKVEKIIPYSSDTDMTPFDVGAYASSTTYLSGQAIKKCASKIRKQILEVAGKMIGAKAKELKIEDGVVYDKNSSKSVSYSEICNYSLYAQDQFQIMDNASAISYESPPPFSAHFALVEVDTLTGIIKILKYVTTVDCGTAIHPRLAEGQSEGAVVNAISTALVEEYIFSDNGRLLNNSFWDYKIYSSMDIPEMVTILVPTFEKSGPFGAKSVSEISTNGPAPAISNAVAHAIGIRLRKTPFTPGVVLNEIKKQGII
ncbi:molybdopterin-dependent oxidoreductase, partial [Candidatus Dependentiae bacterium]|nr:molybdopterin-dependent oxidoreductase [Candidatus Dependentiae bacterium]